MSGSILKRLLKRYSSGTASEAERFLVEKWYGSFGDLGDQIPGLESFELATETKNRMFNKINSRTQKPLRQWYQQPAIRIAASLVIVTSIILLLIPYKQSEKPDLLIYQTVKGENKKITLPDSTLVWLNANTRLEVLSDYAGDFRKVNLVGEAYFQVRPDPERPFIITSGELQTKVLGTSFNVSAYPVLSDIKVAVNTGKVSVSKGNQSLATLTPGKAIHYNRQTQQVMLIEEGGATQSSWRNGRVMLDDASFDELALRFGNMFNTTLSSRENAVRQLRFRLMIDNTLPMEDNLKIITGIHQLKFRKTNENEIELYYK